MKRHPFVLAPAVIEIEGFFQVIHLHDPGPQVNSLSGVDGMYLSWGGLWCPGLPNTLHGVHR